ncbi:hypothetical protein HJG60_010603 [Phyllostomus discolor]|uniref:Uncharacterized protein n=1 Tax=Phyllostomus discolor TaxID=89673 RepID=A0A834AP34_9CHIR|nr:hypothetical protein HJG60_010603 [Phyllostomus discolor]
MDNWPESNDLQKKEKEKEEEEGGGGGRKEERKEGRKKEGRKEGKCHSPAVVQPQLGPGFPERICSSTLEKEEGRERDRDRQKEILIWARNIDQLLCVCALTRLNRNLVSAQIIVFLKTPYCVPPRFIC